MSFLLDTDVCSAHLRGDRKVWQKVQQHTGQLHLSAITLGELVTWVLRSGASLKRRQGLDKLLQDLTILDITSVVGEKFGELRAYFLNAGLGTPDMDLLIAATALVHDLTLVTHNVRDFENVPGLRIQDWINPA